MNHYAVDRAGITGLVKRTASSNSTPTTPSSTTPAPKTAEAYDKSLTRIGGSFKPSRRLSRNTHGVYGGRQRQAEAAIPAANLAKFHSIAAQDGTGSGELRVHAVPARPGEIIEAVSYCVVKMNSDTDTQWGGLNAILPCRFI